MTTETTDLVEGRILASSAIYAVVEALTLGFVPPLIIAEALANHAATLVAMHGDAEVALDIATATSAAEVAHGG